MKILIKTTEELQQFLKVDSTFVVSTLYAYQESAIEQYLRDALGEDLTDALADYYNADDPEAEADLDALLPYAQRVVAKFSFHTGAPNLDLKLTDSGFGVVNNQTLSPASKDRVNRFIESLEREGWAAVEMLLRFLESNQADYPLWVESEAYTMTQRNYINSAEDFDKYVSIGKSRLKFNELRNAMDDVEILEVNPVIGESLATKIKAEIKAGTLTAANLALLFFIKRATANLTAAYALDEKYRIKGEHYLSEVRKMLDRNPDAYPEYRDTIYVKEKTYQRFENSDENGFFVAGS